MTTVRRILSPATVSAFSTCLRTRNRQSYSEIAPRLWLGERSCNLSSRTAPTRATSSSSFLTREEIMTEDPLNNVTDNIFNKLAVNLHQQPNHPLCIIKTAIHAYFNDVSGAKFRNFDDFFPIVSTEANFDELLIPQDHPSRNPNDTYYINQETVLRCHTSAHQAQCLRMKETAFLVTGDVYRRDAIDATHYPVFHQTEGVRVFSPSDWESANLEAPAFIERDLKETLEGLARFLFGDVECRWVDEYFPFTDPSFELEIFFGGEWMEVLGCGVMQQQILDDNYGPGYKAWAFGLGLERLAMVLFGIPDIRLFWSADNRFSRQFKAGDMTSKFKPFSKYPPVYRDMAFWLPADFAENDYYELIRGITGDLCEEVRRVDEFTHPKTQRTSHCYRITYRANERSLVDEEVNKIQFRLRDAAADQLGVELR